MNRNTIHYGSKEAIPKKIALKAGNLDLFYENGFIRYVKLGNQEVLRMINHAVRDYNWGTVPLRIFEEKIISNKDSFTIYYQAEAKQDNIHFLWKCSIIGKEDNTISFTIDGEALSSFKKNRTGFTVLHPIEECKGQEVVIKKLSGNTKTQKFPKLISPTQPFFDVQAMEWNLGTSKALLEFSGDVFETEDQRNWIDASYKTYCTPLGLPFPVLLKKGDKVKQTIKLSIVGESDVAISKDENLTFSIAKNPFALPKINIAQSSEVKELSPSAIKKIKAIRFDYYQVDIKLYESDWKEKLKRAIIESRLLEFPLELSLFFEDTKRELNVFMAIIKTKKPVVAILNIFNKQSHVTQKKTIDLTFPTLIKLFPKASIGAGTNAFFAELNRDRIVIDKLDHIVYSFNPQVHAFDNDSLAETIEAMPYTVSTAKAFSKDKPIHISPITFKMRWNPNATGKNIVDAEQLPTEVDVRQMSLFGASWLLGTINSLLPSKPASITFFETVGMRGIMQSAKPLFTDKFFASANTVYPMYLVFKIIMEHKDWDFYPIKSIHALDFTGFAFGEKGKKASFLLLANYSPTAIKVKVPIDFNNVNTIIIDDKNILQLLENPTKINALKKEKISRNIEIPPFGILLVLENLSV